jgi:Putative zinc-finger
MSNCETIRETVGPWLDGELGDAEAETTRLHVEACAVCGEERRQLERLGSSLHTVLQTDTSKLEFRPFWQGVQERIAQLLAWAVPAIIVIVLAGLSIDSFIPATKIGTQRDNFATVESIDAYGRNVALLHEGETNTTVIWLYQPQEGENDPSTETTETKPSF